MTASGLIIPTDSTTHYDTLPKVSTRTKQPPKSVCLSRNGSGSIGGALKERFLAEGYRLVPDSGTQEAADYVICTSGRMLIQKAVLITPSEVRRMYESNYEFPRHFTEKHIRAMKEAGKRGLIIHIGSNSARYGKPGAEDYAAQKAALWKYLEIRAATAKLDGIRLTCLNLGGVVNDFWRKVREANYNAEVARDLTPTPEKGLTNQDVVETVLAIMNLPARVAMKDCLVVSVDYQ